MLLEFAESPGAAAIIKKGKVFCPAPVGQLKNAYVGDRNQSDRFYAKGFVEAADALVDLALNKNPALNDRFFSPACFLYRHASELTLKNLIRDVEKIIILRGHVESTVCNPSDPTAVDAKLAATHSLESLFNWLDERFKYLAGEALPARVREAMIELHQIDPNGETFRYAKTKSGESHKKFQKTPQIDLGRIRDHLGEAIRFLQNTVGDQLRREEREVCLALLEDPP